MNKLFLILIAFMWTLPRAVVFCDDLDFYIESGYNKNEVISAIAVDRKSHYESECLAEGDAGSHFTYSWEFVSTCSGMSGSRNGYIKSTATCNICTGRWALDELEENENACREDCRTSNYVCQPPSFPEQWGGEIVKKNSNGGACGDLLPNCSESSSSESVESSSSEGDDSSSSFDGSSSSKKVSSSSKNGPYDLVYNYDGFCNNKGNLESAFCSIDCGTGKHYMQKPGFFGPKKFEFLCLDNGIGMYTNIPEIYPNVYLHIECFDSESEAGWSRLNVPDDLPLTYLCYDTELSTIEGCPTAESVSSNERVITLDGNLHTIYYLTLDAHFYNAYYASSVSDLMSDYYWGDNPSDDVFPSNYSRMELLSEPEFVSFFNECKRRMKTKHDAYSMAKENGDNVEQGEDPWDLYSQYVWIGNWEFSGEYYQSRGISSYEDYCRFLRGENAVLYQLDSLLYVEYYDEESSHISKTYEAIHYCAPAKSFSSSVEESSSSESSSSSEKSSSSEESSSSEPPSSSSLSSSSEESSSSSEEIVVESSSVMSVDEPFVAGPDQVYTPDQIFSSGLQNMEPGACYSLNPDRGTIYGWNISYNASDSWWWRKVDCETGEKPVEKGIGNCAAFPGSKPDKVSACYAHNGSCYVCDNSKDYIDCNADWLWNYNFPTHSWFKQVDCYDPYEKHDNQCPDGNALMKRASDYGNAENASDSKYDIDFINNVKYYDVLGRKTSRGNSAKQILYKTDSDKFYQKSMDQLQQTIEGIFEKINQEYNKRALFRRDDCGILGGDYGIIEPDKSRTGGITCPDMRPQYDTPKVLDKNFLNETCEINSCIYNKVKLKIETTLRMKRFSIDYYIVKVGYVFPDGHVTTANDRKALKKHELGHVKDFECIAKKFPNETKYIEVEVDACNEKTALKAAIDKKVQPYMDEMQKEYDERFERAKDLYHKTYGSFEYPKGNYVCPSDL